MSYCQGCADSLRENSALRARLAEVERELAKYRQWTTAYQRWTTQYRSMYQRCREVREDTRDRLRTLEERARDLDRVLCRVDDYDIPYCDICGKDPDDCDDRCRRRRLADALGEK